MGGGVGVLGGGGHIFFSKTFFFFNYIKTQKKAYLIFHFFNPMVVGVGVLGGGGHIFFSKKKLRKNDVI